MRDDVTCRSSNGDVSAAVPDDLSASVTLRTSNGDADVEGVTLSEETASDDLIEGRLGEGDPEHSLTLRSTNGDVTLLGL